METGRPFRFLYKCRTISPNLVEDRIQSQTLENQPHVTAMSAEATEVVIIGGGFAGLSAGVALAGRGFRVAVLEGKPALGGRAYSFVDTESGDFVDNGQHVLMGCYRE